MKEVKLFKFDPFGFQKSHGIIIKITEPLAEFGSSLSLEDADKVYDAQAILLVDALINNLPQGTVYRVLYRLMERYSKEILYRGKTGT